MGNNSLCWLEREGVKYTNQGWIRVGLQKFEVFIDAGWVPVIAEAPVSLTEPGSVLAIGTWQLFGRMYGFQDGFDNLYFVANLFDWLGGI
ncbi:MAG TPA: hypothetical protein VJ180_00435 [Pyrinomonadaceae bacterium]|nr:hypothetical protein [Pyrinomonadaceae bacterium]